MSTRSNKVASFSQAWIGRKHSSRTQFRIQPRGGRIMYLPRAKVVFCDACLSALNFLEGVERVSVIRTFLLFVHCWTSCVSTSQSTNEALTVATLLENFVAAIALCKIGSCTSVLWRILWVLCCFLNRFLHFCRLTEQSSFLALHRSHLNLLEPTLLHRIFRLVKLFRAVRVLRQVWELKILMHLGCCFERQLRGF